MARFSLAGSGTRNSIALENEGVCTGDVIKKRAIVIMALWQGRTVVVHVQIQLSIIWLATAHKLIVPRACSYGKLFP